LISKYFNIKFSHYYFYYYYYFVLKPFMLHFFSNSSLIILLIYNFAFLFFRVCLLCGWSLAHELFLLHFFKNLSLIILLNLIYTLDFFKKIEFFFLFHLYTFDLLEVSFHTFIFIFFMSNYLYLIFIIMSLIC
jgi:hypothetical protein